MRKKLNRLPKMSSIEIDELIEEEKICRIAFIGKEFPYIAPFQYVRIDGSLYVHFTNYGKKMRLIENNNKVCLTIEKFNEDLSEFKFVTLQGELSQVTENNERADAIHALQSTGKKNLSSMFLAAHGFSPNDGWDVLSDEKPLKIYKLGKISKIIGLRSPKKV